MARLWQTGFELDSATAGVEFDTLFTGGSGTITTAQSHGGTYSFLCTLSSASYLDANYQYSTGTGVVYLRAYIYLTGYPSSNCTFLSSYTSVASTYIAGLYMNSSGQVGIAYSVGGTWTYSSTLTSAVSKNAWHYVEIKIDTTTANSQVVTAKLDGTQFDSKTGTFAIAANANNIITFGAYFGPGEAQGTFSSIYFDDIAINDTTGSYQNTWAGAGGIVHLRPNATGDNNQFTTQVGGTAGSANNYTRVNEVTPNDATSYNSDNVTGHTDDYAMTATPSSIGSSDIINVIMVGVVYAGSSSANSTFNVRYKKVSGGTVTSGFSITPNSTSWKTNANASPSNYSLIAYQDPNGGAITKATLDTSQIGVTISAGNTINDVISTLWMSIDSTPSTAINPNVFDTVTVAETVTADTNFLPLSVFDTINVSENVVMSGYSVIVSDNITVAETITVEINSLVINVFDTTNVSESVTIQRAGSGVTVLINVFDTVTVNDSFNYALQFDGVQNYVSLGTMGNFGSNLVNGLYCKVTFTTTSTAIESIIGSLNTGGAVTGIILALNSDTTPSNINQIVRIFLRDDNNLAIQAITTNTYNYNDGNTHTFIVTIIPSTNTVTFSIDGNNQALTYVVQTTPVSFSNFNVNASLAARNNAGTLQQFFSGIIDNFFIGTSASNIYGWYQFNEGIGTTTADSSGNGNTGTLIKGVGAYPLWVTGLNVPVAQIDETNTVFVLDNIQVSENVAVQEVGTAVPLLISLSDNINVSENVTPTEVLNPSVSNNITVAEGISSQEADNSNVFDTVTVAETVTVKPLVGIISVFDSITISEYVITQAIGAGIYLINVFDTTNVSESVTFFTPLGQASVFDTIHVSENVTVVIPTGVIVAPSLNTLVEGSGRQVVRTSSGILYAVTAYTVSANVFIGVYKSTNGGKTWTQQNAINSPNVITGQVAVAIDGNDTLHLLYVLNQASTSQLEYQQYSTITDTFGISETIIAGNASNTYFTGAIAVDSNNVPHIVEEHHTASSGTPSYYNRVGGVWQGNIVCGQVSADINVADITIDTNNLPQLVTVTSSGIVTPAIGNQNDATSFTMDTFTGVAQTSSDASITIDSNNNTWIAYTATSTNYVTLQEHLVGNSWTTWQLPVTDSKVGFGPSLVTNGTNVYVFYQSALAAGGNVSYDRYNGSFAGETIIEQGVYSEPTTKWAYLHNNQGSIQIDFLFGNSTNIFWDKLSLGNMAIISVSDNATVAEIITSQTPVELINVFDTVTVAESIGMQDRLFINVFDTATVAETIGRVLILLLLPIDTITVAESITTLSTSYPVVNDNITVAENVVVFLPSLGINNELSNYSAWEPGVQVRT